jgi:hypothetical protein
VGSRRPEVGPRQRQVTLGVSPCDFGLTEVISHPLKQRFIVLKLRLDLQLHQGHFLARSHGLLVRLLLDKFTGNSLTKFRGDLFRFYQMLNENSVGRKTTEHADRFVCQRLLGGWKNVASWHLGPEWALSISPSLFLGVDPNCFRHPVIAHRFRKVFLCFLRYISALFEVLCRIFMGPDIAEVHFIIFRPPFAGFPINAATTLFRVLDILSVKLPVFLLLTSRKLWQFFAVDPSREIAEFLLIFSILVQ